ncbi:MAG: hypothetical protein DRJ03_00065 [Chloroflexi bacterium]|nr:MAG: hypothetical protein DRJ03_00065 [Chloroflexota bacterium]
MLKHGHACNNDTSEKALTTPAKKETEKQKLSRYCTVNTEFKDGDALVDALMETSKWTAAQIEVHETPQNLFGYHGDKRSQKAHIIIRRQHVGGASNDLGFVKSENGNYKAIVSEYDSRRYGKDWVGRLTGNYAYHKVRREQEARGRHVSRERCPNGRQRVVVTGYR